jgi:predicted site-specific integrase-resolvase
MSGNLIISQVNPEELKNALVESVTNQLNDFKKHLENQNKTTEYLSRNDVSKMLGINLSSVHNWTKNGILKAYQISGRVFYKRSEIEESIVELKKVG